MRTAYIGSDGAGRMRGEAVRTIALDPNGATAIYQQIADEIRGLIARGELEEGSALPSVRELGQRMGVNLNTVAKAYRALADEGLVELRHGSGARVLRPAPAARRARGRAAVADESERRLRDLISRWSLAGHDR